MTTSTEIDQESKGLKDAATGVADEAGRTIEKTAAQSMTQAGDALRQVAQAVRQSGESLQSEQPQIARFISTAADKVDEAASYVSTHEPRELMDSAQNLARQQPALIVGGGLVAGILIGRLLRSAGGPASGQGGQGMSRQSGQNWYGAGYRTGDAASGRPSTAGPAGYGTSFGADYDQSTSAMRRSGMTGTMTDYGSEQATDSSQSRSNGGSGESRDEG